MTFQDYIPLAVRTESSKDPFSKEFVESSGMNARIFHAIIGMATEASEALDYKDKTNLLEELGDYLWYAAVLEDTIPGTVSIFDNINADIGFCLDGDLAALNTVTMKMLDHAKKVLMYGKPLDIHILQSCASEAVSLIFALIEILRDTPSNIMQKNIAKLRARYPEKFTEYHADNRDLETERKILES